MACEFFVAWFFLYIQSFKLKEVLTCHLYSEHNYEVLKSQEETLSVERVKLSFSYIFFLAWGILSSNIRLQRSYLNPENKVVKLFPYSSFHGDCITVSGKTAISFIVSWRKLNAQVYLLVPCFPIVNSKERRGWTLQLRTLQSSHDSASESMVY